MVGDSNVVGIDILGKQVFLADSFRLKKVALVAAPSGLPAKSQFFSPKYINGMKAFLI
jgi:hypothetical protein